MKSYIWIEKDEENYNAGFKAVSDITDILINEGVCPMYISATRKKIFLFKYFIYLKMIIVDLCNIYKEIIAESEIVVQIPLKIPRYIVRLYLWFLKFQKKCRLIAVVHDVEQIRYSHGNTIKKSETKIFQMFDALIVHNKKMQALFEKEFKIDKEKIYELEIFDYLTSENVETGDNKDKMSIVIAGNLSKEKAGYIYKLPSITNNMKVILYGTNLEEELDTNIVYRGKIPSDKIANVISRGEAQFGLIWDGDSIDGCEGLYGKYMLYNNPHKLSLFLASEIPVIVWEKAAIKDFVIENNVGFSINSLREVESLLMQMDKAKINELVNNAKRVGQRLREGHYTIAVLNKMSIVESKEDVMKQNPSRCL